MEKDKAGEKQLSQHFYGSEDIIMYNEYEQYVMLAGDTKAFAENKIQMDLDRLDKMSDYKEVEDFVLQNYGDAEGEGLNILFPNNIELAIRKYENAIEIVAVQEEYVIFSKGWRLVQDEAEDKEE